MEDMKKMNKAIITDFEEMDECPFHRDSELNLFYIAKMLEADRAGSEGE